MFLVTRAKVAVILRNWKTLINLRMQTLPGTDRRSWSLGNRIPGNFSFQRYCAVLVILLNGGFLDRLLLTLTHSAILPCPPAFSFCKLTQNAPDTCLSAAGAYSGHGVHGTLSDSFRCTLCARACSGVLFEAACTWLRRLRHWESAFPWLAVADGTTTQARGEAGGTEQPV